MANFGGSEASDPVSELTPSSFSVLQGSKTGTRSNDSAALGDEEV
jgi:hypothetical protein